MCSISSAENNQQYLFLTHLNSRQVRDVRQVSSTYNWKPTPPSWERWGNTAPGQHEHIAQTPEEKNFWASLIDSVNAESVLVQVLV